MEYCPTNKMIANKLTKALALDVFAQLQDKFIEPNIIADAFGKSFCTTTWRLPMGCHSIGASWPINWSNVNV